MPGRKWKRDRLKLSFWSLNLGLIFMVILSMLPVGLLQAWASIERGTWYARSAEFMQSGSMQTLRWMRVPGRHPVHDWSSIVRLVRLWTLDRTFIR